MKNTVLSFKVEPELKTALEHLARRENRSVSNYVQTVLLKHLEAQGVDFEEFKATCGQEE